MELVNVESIQENSRYTGEITIDGNLLVCGPGLPVTAGTLAALEEWGFTEVQVTGQAIEKPGAEGAAENPVKPAAESAAPLQPEPEQKPAQPSEKEAPPPERTVLPAEKAAEIRIALRQMVDFKDSKSTEKEKQAIVQSIYDKYIEYLDALFSRYDSRKDLQHQELPEMVKILEGVVSSTRRYLLQVQPAALDPQRSYLLNHALRSTVIAMIIGMQMALTSAKLVELGISCILHEIGMIRLPPDLYLSAKKLTDQEKKQLSIHPLLGYNILKESGFSPSILRGVLQHHEKEDGSGYPYRIKGDKISLFAKIISVACTYEAITSARAYKDKESAHKATVELLKNTGNHYDKEVMRALLFSLSLYPIGTYVFLSDGKAAVVVDVNSKDPKRPVVQLLKEKESSGAPKIITTGGDLRVLRALTPDETAGIKKSLEGPR
ncbi:MAG: HD domain-containing protein [Spirochaetaceae bacterium]|nr:HD domain-containing protein [Spirochaetaceae bacterium]